MSSLLAIAACNDMIAPENASVADGDGIAYFVSTMEGNDATTVEDDTKTVLSSDRQYRVFWEETDHISIYDGTEAHQYKATPYADANGNNTTAHFYPVQENLVLPSGKKYYALYPHDESAEWNGSKVTFTIPTDQTAVIDNFAYNASVAVSDKDNNLKFCNIGALMQFQLNTSGVQTVVLEAVGGEPLTGKVTMDCSDPDNQESLTVVDGCSTLTLDGTGSKSTFYVTIIPGTYSKGIKIMVFGKDGYQSATVKSFTLNRCARISLILQFSTGNTQGFQGAYQGQSASAEQMISDDSAPGGFYYPLACGLDVAGENLTYNAATQSWNDMCIKDGMIVDPCPDGWNLPTSAQIDVLVVAAKDAIHYAHGQNCYWRLRDGSLLDGKVLWGLTTFQAMSCDEVVENSNNAYRYQYQYTKKTENEVTTYYLAKNNKSSHAKSDKNKTGTIFRCVREAQQ